METGSYLAEGVAAVIELKSDLSDQWGDVTRTAQNVRKLTRSYTSTEVRDHGGTYRRTASGSSMSGMTKVGGEGFRVSQMVSDYERRATRIPIFAVGYKGWAKTETLKKHLSEGHVDAALVIESGAFVSGQDFQNREAAGETGLWAFINCLHRAAAELSHVDWNPWVYG